MYKDTTFNLFLSSRVYFFGSNKKFLKLIDEGMIMYDIRIGSYGSGRNYGKAHDHGSGFRILERNLHHLFENHECI